VFEFCADEVAAGGSWAIDGLVTCRHHGYTRIISMNDLETEYIAHKSHVYSSLHMYTYIYLYLAAENSGVYASARPLVSSLSAMVAY
jgi:hypothetical protein